MSYFFQRRPPRRAPRAIVRGRISVVIQLENGRQLTGKLRQFSITGGLLDLPTYVEERTWVKVTIYLASGLVRTTAEMMFPMRGGIGYLQPFRFISLGENELHAVDREVTEMLRQAVGATRGQVSVSRPPRSCFEWL